MKIHGLLTALCFSLSAAVAGEQLIDEAFTSLPDSAKWKISGDVTAAEGKMKMVASGNEASFANAVLQFKDPMNELNFISRPVEFEISKLVMEGTAPAPKQAFVISLATDPSEASAAGYLRLCVDGDGKMTLAVSAGEPGEGRRLETLASGPAVFPVSDLVLRLDDKGYLLKYKDAGGPQELKGEWDGKIDPSSWQGAAPVLVVKTVRRPAEGNCEVTLGSFEVKNP